MNSQQLIDSLQRFADVLPAIVSGVTPENARWKPANGAWSVLEVVRHMLDEEIEDFRRRLEMTLRDPAEPWPPNDPEAWAVERRYNEANLNETVARFVAERRESVKWLRTLQAPDWSQAYQHPKFGPIHAGDLLASWAAHDCLHLRQIAKRMFEMTQRAGGKFTTDYAGEWKA